MNGIKNTLYLLIGILAAFILANIELFDIFLNHVRQVTYFDAFIGGVLFAFTFTFAVGGLITVSAAENMHPLLVAVIGGFGCMLSDLLIFRFVRSNIKINAAYVCGGPNKGYLSRLYCHRYFQWTLPVLGAIIIASPLPDEVGVTLMGIAEMSTKKFVLLAFLIDTIGIFIFIMAARLII